MDNYNILLSAVRQWYLYHKYKNPVIYNNSEVDINLMGIYKKLDKTTQTESEEEMEQKHDNKAEDILEKLLLRLNHNKDEYYKRSRHYENVADVWRDVAIVVENELLQIKGQVNRQENKQSTVGVPIDTPELNEKEFQEFLNKETLSQKLNCK
jgi:hypothetical protein